MMRLFAIAATLLVLQSCREAGDYKNFVHDPLLYCKTVKKLNDIVLENNFPPMIGSRNYAYANIAAYEVIASGDDSNYTSLAGQIKSLPAIRPWTKGNIDYPLAAILAFTKVGNAVTFPEGSMMEYYDKMVSDADSAGMPAEMIKNSQAFADQVVDQIMTWSKKDHYAQTRSAEKYTVTDQAGRWVPTPPMYAQGM